MAMDLFSVQNLVFFLMTSSLPAITSLQQPSSSLPRISDVKDLGGQYIALIRHQAPVQAENYLIVKDYTNQAERRSPDHVQDAPKRTEEMEKILDRIHDSLVTVEKGRQKLEKLQRSQSVGNPSRQQPSLGPKSHFLRIGRQWTKPDRSEGYDPIQLRSLEGTRDSSIYQVNGDYPSSEGSALIHITSTENDDGESVNEKANGVHTSDSRGKIRSVLTKRKDRYLRLRRRYSPRSRVMRFGRSTDLQTVKRPFPSADFPDIFLPLCRRFYNQGFLRIGRRSPPESESDARARYLNHISGLAHRSFVRIGRLPSSVFRQRLRTNSKATSGDLSGRRSPGYRLTTSGIVRLGKRPSC